MSDYSALAPFKELEKYEEYLKIKSLYWDIGTNEFVWLDTRLLPFEEVYRRTRDYKRVAQAIKTMEIRGAPAIGVSAAYGMALAALYSKARNSEELMRDIREAYETLRSTRPTAYNLFWALDRVLNKAQETSKSGDPEKVKEAILEEAATIHVEDVRSNISIGKHGSKLIDNGDVILTHCNTGVLATSGFGTALGVIRYAWYEGKKIKVITTETRPVLQGARLNVWELKKEGIPFTLITDGMPGLVFRQGMADLAIVGADRIILTGHTANKIGTYMVALAAFDNDKPFYVAAPTSTIQKSTNPEDIVIEVRDPEEVRTVLGRYRLTLPDVDVYNPSFDITPPRYITGIITEKGVVYPPYIRNLRAILE
ncbi:MAG: S-methyl-5-thioribose-1-phosphate isomerase [Desulfurococcales archaeon]|nr:S-methyl-5-thioribose-1-phosphate isomerase [Desulfurococcales archaeon]